MNIFKKSPPARTTRFSEFIRNARSDEKKRVYMTVLQKATNDQIEILHKAQELNKIKTLAM
jgi:hypothetical protein